MPTCKPTAEQVKSYLGYDPDTGAFTWLVSRRAPAMRGSPAGGINNGYVRIKIHNIAYGAHRLAFVVMESRWPEHFIDHINGDPLDNRWSNLREATNSQNQANRRLVKPTSGYRGVTWHRQCRKWQAGIKKDGKTYHLGLFDNPCEAHAAYVAASVQLFGAYSAMTDAPA